MKYHIITFGCQMNEADSEQIAAFLEKGGHKPASKIEDADLIVVNMCSVRQSAVDRVYGKIRYFAKLKIKNKKLKTILTGCILKKDRKKFAEKFDQILSIKKFLNCPPKYKTDFRAFIPISNGCNNFCSYCVVPYTRGSLICRNHKEIIKEAKGAIEKGLNPIRGTTSNGAREIWLLGQNVNDYKSLINRESDSRIFANKLETDSRVINFAKLLKMINAIPGNFSIRFMSPHPADFSDELINVIANSEKVAKFLHLPVQSGDNKILKKMNRPYTVSQYKNLIRKIRKKIPKVNLSTDVIVGFPGETKKQFENTVKLFKETKFNLAFVAKYSPRSGTTASKLKDNVPWEEKKRREKVLIKILKEKARR